MRRRIIEVSGFDATLSVRHRQILVFREKMLAGQFPAEDCALLIVDTPNTSLSSSAVLAVLDAGGLVVICGEDHLPAAVATPLQGNNLLQERMRCQLEATAPAKKRLWQEIVQAKIHNQASICTEPEIAESLRRLARSTRSGDPNNHEAQAARLHWSCYLPPPTATQDSESDEPCDSQGPFRRDRNGAPPNNLLNYAYMTLRAMVARSLYVAGLHPAFGIHHSNRENAFCLADDLVEPFRPFADRIVRQLHLRGHRTLEKDTKREILSILHERCIVLDTGSTVTVAADRLAYSVLRRLMGDSDLPLSLPLLAADPTAIPPNPELSRDEAGWPNEAYPDGTPPVLRP
jgi:CRISPR-associated protein Cas1